MLISSLSWCSLRFPPLIYFVHVIYYCHCRCRCRSESSSWGRHRWFVDFPANDYRPTEWIILSFSRAFQRYAILSFRMQFVVPICHRQRFQTCPAHWKLYLYSSVKYFHILKAHSVSRARTHHPFDAIVAVATATTAAIVVVLDFIVNHFMYKIVESKMQWN